MYNCTHQNKTGQNRPVFLRLCIRQNEAASMYCVLIYDEKSGVSLFKIPEKADARWKSALNNNIAKNIYPRDIMKMLVTLLYSCLVSRCLKGLFTLNFYFRFLCGIPGFIYTKKIFLIKAQKFRIYSHFCVFFWKLKAVPWKLKAVP